MPLVAKAKRVMRGYCSDLSSRKLKLKDGTYLAKYRVKHQTERCGWEQFGAPNKAEYERWWQEACGIVSLRTIVDVMALGSQQKTIYEQINHAIDDGAYLPNIGWKHDGLVRLAKQVGLRGHASPLVLNGICKAILGEKLVIASVYRPFTRFINEGAERKKRGGHLVVIKGFTWKDGRCTGLFVEDPYDIEQRTEPVDSQLFEEVYSSAAITIHK